MGLQTSTIPFDAASPGPIGGTTPAAITGTTGTFTDTTDSSNTSTGALKVSGGVGIAKQLYVNNEIVSTGGYLRIPGDQYFQFNGRARIDAPSASHLRLLQDDQSTPADVSLGPLTIGGGTAITSSGPGGALASGAFAVAVAADSGWTANADAGDKTKVIPAAGDLNGDYGAVELLLGATYATAIRSAAEKVKALETALAAALRPNV